MRFSLTTLMLLGASTATVLPRSDSSTSKSRCKEVAFTVTGSAQNMDFSGVDLVANLTVDLANVLGAIAEGGVNLTTVSGTETLAGWYCLPNATNSNNDKLQILRGSFFTNRESWTALGGTALFDPPLEPYKPEMYSWVDHFNNLGYPTLAIDTLGTGASSSPDPLLVAQIPYQLSLYHDLVEQIKNGTTGQISKTYTDLIHIGNSLGSVFGQQMATFYPEDFSAMVLTGWSDEVDSSLLGVSLNLPLPAVVENSTRFAGKPLLYLTSSVEQALTNSFFGSHTYVDFEDEVSDLFFERRDTVSIGDVLNTYIFDTPPATTYTGRVLVLTGEEDQAFCGLGSSLLSPDTQCGTLLATSSSIFPVADYNYQAVNATGHAIILHETVQQTFSYAAQFLSGSSFGK